MRGITCIGIVAGALAAAAGAEASAEHRVDGYVSAEGVEFIEEEIASLLPDELVIPEISGSLECLEVALRETEIRPEVHDVAVEMPADGVAILDVEFSVESEGGLYVDGCGLDTTCESELIVDRGAAVVESHIEVSGGEPNFDVEDVQLDIDDNDTHIELSGCALEDSANLAITVVQTLAFDFVVDFIADFAAYQVAPIAESILVGFADLEGKFGPTDLHIRIDEALTGSRGIFASLGVSLESQLREPSGCVGQDAPPPSTHEGAAPNLADGTPAHVGAAVNLGLVDDILYNAWRAGLMCLSDAHIEAVGIDLDIDGELGKLLPGFPPGTEFSLEVRVMRPPRLEATSGKEASVTLIAEEIEADLIGSHAGGEEVLEIVAGARATAEVALDEDARALVLRAGDVEVTRLELGDQVGDRDLELDPSRLIYVVEEHIAPGLIEEFGEIPVSGSVVGMAGYYILVRELFTTESHLAAKIDLFSAPDDDDTRPTTSIDERPNGPIAAGEPAFRADGSDPVTPSELLRFRVVVDGEEELLTHRPEIAIGEPGETAERRVEVSAVDASGNEDPNPITMDVVVDGVAPDVHLKGGGAQRVDGGSTAEIAWEQSDDVTREGELEPRVSVYRVRSPRDLLDVELVEEAELEPGATSYEVEVPVGELYRVEVRVRDEAGNEGVASARVRANSSGCAGASPGAAGSALAVALLLAGLARMRRRGDERAIA